MKEKMDFINKKCNDAVRDASPLCKGCSVADVLLKASAMILSCSDQLKDNNKSLCRSLNDLRSKEDKDTFDFDSALPVLLSSSRAYLVAAYNQEYLLEKENKKDDPMFG